MPSTFFDRVTPAIIAVIDAMEAEKGWFGKAAQSAPVISAHFRTSRNSGPELVKSLAELIVAAQDMLEEDAGDPWDKDQ